MNTLVALFRGINVGGHNKLPMQALRDLIGSLACQDVRTCIQSGNAVFRTEKDPASLAAELEAAVEAGLGFKPAVLILGIDEFRAIAAANPHGDAEQTPSKLHVAFLTEVPADPDLDRLEGLRSPTESFALIGRAFFLHAPDGIGRSKLSASVETVLGVAATGRNWRTVAKILALADEAIL